MIEKGQRFLVITELFLPTKGGSAVWFDEVYRRLGGKGIHIVTADVPGAAQYDMDHPNTVHRISLSRHWWLRPESLAMYAKLFSRSLGLALRERFTEVHAGRVLPEGLVGWIVARSTRRPILVYAHGEEITTWRQPLKYRIMRFVYRNADHVIANSRFTKDELIKLGVDEGRIALISPGVDVERFRPGLDHADLRQSLGLKPEQGLVLSVGRLSRRKGFDQVIRAVKQLAEEGLDIHYALIGIGEDEQYLRDLARDVQADDRVHLLGHVPAVDLARWYNACDVFAMPNREVGGDTEGFGMVFVEAAACEKPVIAGTSGGTGSAVIDNETGLLVDGESLEKIVAALRGLLGQPDRAKLMGTRARTRVVSELSWGQVAKRTLAVGYEQTVEHSVDGTRA